MSDELSSLAGFFGGSSPGQGLGDLGALGGLGAGLFGNISNAITRSQQLNNINSAEKAASNPTALAAQVASATQPLNQGLVQSVGNTVSGSLAEQGLSQAPGIQATELSQSLAPFEQQNQQTAMQLVLQRLGIPIQGAQAILGSLGNTNLAPLMALLFGKQGSPGMGQGFGNFGINQPGANLPGGLNPASLLGLGSQLGDDELNSYFPQTITDTPIDTSGGVSA
jgi:hypothetical protein